MFLQAIDNAIMVFTMCREPWELSVTAKHCTYLTTNHLGLPDLGALPVPAVVGYSLSVRKHKSILIALFLCFTTYEIVQTR
jgi:hypothetical protein